MNQELSQFLYYNYLVYFGLFSKTCNLINFVTETAQIIIYTVWPEILAGNLFWRIGGFESNLPIFHPPKTSQCDVIIIAKS